MLAEVSLYRVWQVSKNKIMSALKQEQALEIEHFSELTAGKNQMCVVNVCHCMHNVCSESRNSVVWMTTVVPINHILLIAHRVTSRELGRDKPRIAWP